MYGSGRSSITVLAALTVASPAGASMDTSWSLSGTVSAPLGSSIELVPDLDADGWPELAVVASEGCRIDIFRGVEGGWSTSCSWSLVSPNLALDFGTSLARGDFDGDGRADLAVGAPAPFGSAFLGAVWIYPGFDGPPVAIRPPRAGGRFGSALAWVDSDGDGRDELFVGSPTHSGPTTHCGRVDWYVPGESGWNVHPRRSFFGVLAGDGLGATVVSAGDLNGDGAGELLICAPDASRGQNREGLALLYAGSRTGPSAEPVWREQGEDDFGYFGSAAASAGDTDQNGANELLVSGWGIDDARGEVRLFEWRTQELAEAEQVGTLLGERTIDFFGLSLAGEVDLNGDGIPDCLIGAPGADEGGSSSGKVLSFSRAEGTFVEICQVEGKAGEQLGSEIAAIQTNGAAAWATTAPWLVICGVRVGRAVAGHSKPVTDAAAWDPTAKDFGLFLRNNPVTVDSRLDLWGRAGERVEVVFSDVMGRRLRRVSVGLAAGEISIPFWDSPLNLPGTGWVSVRQGHSTVSTRWVRGLLDGTR